MKFLDFFKKSTNMIFILLFVVSSFIFPNNIFAEFMQSTTYKIQSDSLNIGGEDSSSTGYIIKDTLGEVSTGNSSSTNYALHAGFRQMQVSSISITTPSDLVLSSIGGMSNTSSEGSVSWTVITDNSAGYNMTISSSTTPALKSTSDSFGDYVPFSSDPDYTFTNPPTNSSFGFSPEGTEINNRFKDNGIICNISTLDTASKCWDGLSTTPKDIAGIGTSNMPSGGTTSVRFRAENGVNHIQSSGAYSATIIVTAIVL